MPDDRSSSRLLLSKSRTSPDAKSAVNPTLKGLGILHLRKQGRRQTFHHYGNRPYQQSAVGAHRNHLKSLLHPHSPVFNARGHDPAGQPSRANAILDTQNFLCDTWTLPFTRKASRSRKIRRAEEKPIQIGHLEN